MKIIPFGYSTPGSEALLHCLLEDPNTLLIDVRRVPVCSWNSHWQRASLAQKYSQQYHFAGDYLGNVNFHTGQPIKLADPTTGLRGLFSYLREGKILIVLCACKYYGKCHTKTICDLAKEQMPDILIEQPFYTQIQSKELSSTQIRCYCCGTWLQLYNWKGKIVYCDACEEDTSGVYRKGPGRAECAYCRAYPNNHWSDPRPALSTVYIC